MAKVRFLMQGLEKKKNHRNSLEELIEMDEANEIILSSAFLTSDGVYVLKESLKKSKDKISMYIGCRNGITSKQGIISLIELGIIPYVIDTGSRNFIFHPKVFLSVGDSTALSTVGSANFTYGGLINNIESSTIIDLDLANESDIKYVKDFRESFKELKVRFPENVIKVTSIEVAEQLFEEGRLIDEAESRETIKGKSKEGKRIAPTMRIEREHVSVPKKKKNLGNKKDLQEVVVVENTGLRLIEVWKSKELKQRDLNIPDAATNTNVTGSMLLKKGQYDVDQQVYFRNTVFNKLKWMPKRNKPDYFNYAEAQFYFLIEGVDFGVHSLEIKHDTRTNTRTYEQRQPMTHLLWGDARSLVANSNLLDKQLTLYKVSDSKDKFVIEIDEANS